MDGGQQTGHQTADGLQMHRRKSLLFCETWDWLDKDKACWFKTVCSWQSMVLQNFTSHSEKKGGRQWEETTKSVI